MNGGTVSLSFHHEHILRPTRMRARSSFDVGSQRLVLAYVGRQHTGLNQAVLFLRAYAKA